MVAAAPAVGNSAGRSPNTSYEYSTRRSELVDLTRRGTGRGEVFWCWPRRRHLCPRVGTALGDQPEPSRAGHSDCLPHGDRRRTGLQRGRRGVRRWPLYGFPAAAGERGQLQGLSLQWPSGLRPVILATLPPICHIMPFSKQKCHSEPQQVSRFSQKCGAAHVNGTSGG